MLSIKQPCIWLPERMLKGHYCQTHKGANSSPSKVNKGITPSREKKEMHLDHGHFLTNGEK